MTTLAWAIFLRCVMTLLLLEALGALVLLGFIVWWTMFSGRKNGELKEDLEDKPNKDPTSSSKSDDRS
jgi:hypothetical protein